MHEEKNKQEVTYESIPKGYFYVYIYSVFWGKCPRLIQFFNIVILFF